MLSIRSAAVVGMLFSATHGLGAYNQSKSLEWMAEDGQVRRYRLYVPELAGDGRRSQTLLEDGQAVQQWPLLMWMHGHGDGGADNVSHLHWMELLFEMTDQSPPMFILAVQKSLNEYWLSAATESSEGRPLAESYEILNQVIAEYAIDPDRIYLLGISEGGTAAWELACQHPDRFAAVLPLGAGGADLTRLYRLRHLPIWAFHARGDTWVRPDGARATVAAIQQEGGVAYLTETDEDDHYCWIRAFREYDIVDWMLAQRRGQPVRWLLTNYSLHKWGQAAAWSGLIITFAVAVYLERRRQRIVHSRDHQSRLVSSATDMRQIKATN